jgi:hypothetical protein
LTKSAEVPELSGKVNYKDRISKFVRSGKSYRNITTAVAYLNIKQSIALDNGETETANMDALSMIAGSCWLTW